MNRKKLMKRIKQMMQITEERGATEAEALTATKKVSELLEKYNLSMNEIEIREMTCVEGEIVIGKSRPHPVIVVSNAIAVLLGVKSWISRGSNFKILFFGLPHDVEVAIYLMALCQNAMESELVAFRKSNEYLKESQFYNGNSIRASFMHGMGNRLSGRIIEMSEEAECARNEQAESTALVLVKNETIEGDFNKLNIKLVSSKGPSRTVSSSASYHSGIAAANSVALNPGIV